LLLNQDIAKLVSLSSKDLYEVPLQRRQAIIFKYGNIDPAEYGMSSLASALANPNGPQKSDKSSVHRALHAAPTDSWEIELCVGLVVRLLVVPNFETLQQLGRALLVLKVHKKPMVCEAFFMKHEDVVATYKERMPRTLEWVSLYDPRGEIVFWAELYQPSTGRRTGGSNSYLTDELCGGFGSRFTMREHYTKRDIGPQFLEQALSHLSCTEEERQARVEQALSAREKTKAKKARQKANKAEKKRADEEEAQRLATEKEAEERAALRSRRIAAPSLHEFDWSKLRQDRQDKQEKQAETE